MGYGPTKDMPIVPPVDSWGVFEREPHSPIAATYVNMLAPTPWIFRSPNRAAAVLGMMLVLAILVATLMGSAAQAKDFALILNDQQKANLATVLDMATKAYGLQVAPVTVDLKRLLDAAPEVTKQSPSDDAEKKEPKQ